MIRLLLCAVTALVMSLSLATHGLADDLLLAKVYRDYPGYIATPTCDNPRFSERSADSRSATMQNWGTPRPWTLTPMLGYHVIDGGLRLEDNASVGMAIAYDLTRNWTVEADLRFTPTETDIAPGRNVDVDIWAVGVGVLYHFTPGQRLNPYLGGGIGGLIYDSEGTSGNDEDFMGFWGGGFKYAFNEVLGFRLDLRHILNVKADKEFRSDDDSKLRHHLQAMAGLTIRFGR